MSRACRVLLLTALATAPLGAQVRIGFLAGGVSANVAAADSQIPNRTSRTGFMAGISARMSLGKHFSVGPEVTYLQKGFRAKDNSGTISEAFNVSYLEVPLLLHAALGAGSVHPYLIGGPSLAFNIRCKLRLSGQGLDVTRDCKELDADVTSSDFGAVVGAGIAFGRIGVSVRYDVGMKNVNKKSVGNDEVKNRTLMGVVSVAM